MYVWTCPRHNPMSKACCFRRPRLQLCLGLVAHGFRGTRGRVTVANGDGCFRRCVATAAFVPGNTRHGFGIQTWPDNTKYEGEWRNNQAVAQFLRSACFAPLSFRADAIDPPRSAASCVPFSSPCVSFLASLRDLERARRARLQAAHDISTPRQPVIEVAGRAGPFSIRHQHEGAIRQGSIETTSCNGMWKSVTSARCCSS